MEIGRGGRNMLRGKRWKGAVGGEKGGGERREGDVAAGEGKIPIHLIMVHAQDHLMTAMLAKELIIELIDIYRNRG